MCQKHDKYRSYVKIGKAEGTSKNQSFMAEKVDRPFSKAQ